jgi:transposase InsO family protein
MRAHQFLPQKPPRKRQAVRWHIGEKDVVSLFGVPHTCIKNSPAGYRFARVGDPEATVAMSREEFNDIKDLQSFDFERDGMDSEKALAALQAPVRSLMDLPEEERSYIHFKVRACEKFLRMKAVGQASLYVPHLKYVLNVIQRELDEESKQKRGGRNARAPHKVVGPEQFTRVWLRRFLEGGPLGLCDRYHNCGNHNPYYTAEEYEVLIEYAWKYLSRERPTIAMLWGDMDEEFGRKNAERRKKGLPDLRVPDDDRLRIEIERIPLFDRIAARHGEDYARNRFRPALGGVPDLRRPMQRVEMDDWTTNLHVLLVDTKLWNAVSPELKKVAETTRATLSAAICCTTCCLPAVHLSLGPDGSNTRVLLRMMLTDKTDIARRYGCETPWEYRASPNTVVVDEGTAFVNDDTQFICTDLGIGFKSPQAEMPRQRGKIERWFQTLDIRALARFSGRAFSNPVVRGKYEAQARACVTLEELAALIVRFIVDQYHNMPHAGLGGETPRACWLRRSKQRAPTVPPGRNRIRRAFGQDFTAAVQASGIEIFGNWYQSSDVQQVFETRGNVEVTVRVDSEDLGAISLRQPGGWLTVLGPEIMNGVSVAVWDGALADLRRQNKDLQKLVRPVVHHAIAYAKKADEETRKRLSILYRPMSPEDLVGARARMRVGVRYRDETVRPQTAPTDIFADAVPVGGPAPKAADAAAPETPAEVAKPRRKSRAAHKRETSVPTSNAQRSRQRPPRNWTYKTSKE